MERDIIDMKIVTAKEMQDIDRIAIDDYGIPGIVLMENAAKGVVASLFKKFPDIKDKKIGIFAGKGNNGGDGLAVARLLTDKGIATKVYLLSKKDMLRGDAKTNLEKAEEIGIKILEITSLDKLEAIKDNIRKKDIFINSLKKIVLSIDIPSGLSSDTGEIIGEYIRADMTVALCLPKIGEILYPAAEYVGELNVVDIGIPELIINNRDIKTNLIEEKDAARILPKKKADTNKK